MVHRDGDLTPFGFSSGAECCLQAEPLPHLSHLDAVLVEDREITPQRRLTERREVLLVNVIHPCGMVDPVLAKHISIESCNEASLDNHSLRLSDPELLADRDFSKVDESICKELLLLLGVGLPKAIEGFVGLRLKLLHAHGLQLGVKGFEVSGFEVSDGVLVVFDLVVFRVQVIEVNVVITPIRHLRGDFSLRRLSKVGLGYRKR